MSERSSSKAGAQPSPKPKRARDDLFEDFEEGMVSETEDQEGSPGAGHSPRSPARSRSRSPERPPPRSPFRTPNPFVERGTGATALRNSPPLPSRDDDEGSNVVTNDLDEAQSQQLDVRREASRSNIPAALPLAKKSRKDYHFGGSKDPAKEANELAKGSLVEYVIGPAARSDAELAKRDAWRKRLLTRQTANPAKYCVRLDAQLGQSSVPQIHTIPVVLVRGEDEVDDDAQFQNWAEKARKLSSLDALRASYCVRDIYLERRLRFNFAKRKARQHHSPGQGQRPHETSSFTPAASASAPYSEALSDVSSPRSSAARRGSTGVLVASSSSASGAPAQKRQLLEGSPAVGVPRTPRTEARHAIVPSTGYGPGADAASEAAPRGSGAPHAHRATPEDDEPPLDPRAVRRQLDELQEQVRVNREFRHWAAEKFDRFADDLDAVERGLRDLSDQATQNSQSRGQTAIELRSQVATLRGQLELLAMMQRGAALPPP
ncbi:hypothetical protein PR001_g21217 [Phytophthora rubi]|uniref:Uncharacterized protein n=1 Tax=Phytophthora rubi TaxID=129364 RepID=A0A6A3J9X9_9STRA|nr:hypothetical protein PR001_g21217 [Phytophthora rubi]